MSNGENKAIWSTRPKQKTIKETVVYELVDAILDGRLPVGSRMPPEPEMCERLGVSRVAFREAVKQLEVLGFLRIDRGNGTVVTAPTFSCNEPIIEFLGKSGGISFEELHQVRRLIEVEVVRLVAASPAEDLVARLQSILDEIERGFDKESSHIDLDYEFHKTILDASPNRILPLILSPFTAQLYKSRKMSFKGVASSRKAFEVHKAILAAIRRKDPKEAGTLMDRHLDDTAEDLGFGGVSTQNRKKTKH